MTVMCMQTQFNDALADFANMPGFTEATEWHRVAIDFSANCHQRPRPLHGGVSAVYAFFQGNIWLRIGHASYPGRFTSQHYGIKRSGSSFAEDMWANREEFGFNGPASEIGEWIQANFGRANVILPPQWPKTVSPLLEAYLHYRLNPRFEGPRRDQRT